MSTSYVHVNHFIGLGIGSYDLSKVSVNKFLTMKLR